MNRTRQLSGLSHRHKPGVQRQRQRGAEQEASALQANHVVDLFVADVQPKSVDELAEQRGTGENRKEVLKQDSLAREVGEALEVGPQFCGYFGDGGHLEMRFLVRRLGSHVNSRAVVEKRVEFRHVELAHERFVADTSDQRSPGRKAALRGKFVPGPSGVGGRENRLLAAVLAVAAVRGDDVEREEVHRGVCVGRNSARGREGVRHQPGKSVVVFVGCSDHKAQQRRDCEVRADHERERRPVAHAHGSWTAGGGQLGQKLAFSAHFVGHLVGHFDPVLRLVAPRKHLALAENGGVGVVEKKDIQAVR